MDRIKKIGIVGGGQLAQMMVLAAKNLNLQVIVVDPTPNCPAAIAGAKQIVADYKDEAAIRQLAEQVDVVTIDFEHINTDVLQNLAESGKQVHPAPATVAMIQDKLKQSEFLKSNNLPLADFSGLRDLNHAKKILSEFDGKMLLKKRKHSYDGKGNALVDSEENLVQAWDELGQRELYAERFIDFSKELAVIIARDTAGKSIIYPVVETIHINNICHEVLCPPRIEVPFIEKAIGVATDTAKHLDGAGVFAIEMFLTKSGEILINEIAPRVHNSGHLTIEACETSQFEQHLRAISGMELGPTDMKVPASVMINILGNRNGSAQALGIKEAEQIEGVTLHLYDKKAVKPGRKMGHITAVADTLEEAKARAEQAHSLVKI